MANTTVQHKAETWILQHGLPSLYKSAFVGRRVKLNWGGLFAFDAVSDDGAIIANISTSSARTATNKLATAKFQKIKADTLYLLHVASGHTRLLVFTERDMKEHFEKETRNGRFPKGIKLLHIALPASLQREVEAARKVASDETSPRKESAL